MTTGRSAVDDIVEKVRERVRREGIDLASDRALADRYVRDEVQRYSERALGGSLPLLGDERAAARQVVAALTGLGPLQPYLDDPTVEELWINAPDRVFVAREGVSERVPLELTEQEVRDLVERMLVSSGRRVDLASPFVDGELDPADEVVAGWRLTLDELLQGTVDLRQRGLVTAAIGRLGNRGT